MILDYLLRMPVRYSSTSRISLIMATVCLFTFIVTPQSAYAINDIIIDGDLSDWSDENGFYTDPYQDTNPERTDITQFGLAVIDNGANPESLALLMVTEDYQDTGNASGDSHKVVFTVGSYEIVITIQNGCNAVNEVTINGSTSIAYSGVAVDIIDPPIYASSGDLTPDCAVEIELPISTLPDLDVDVDGELLDENFSTAFVSRQSGGVGNDNDTDEVGGLTPTAVTNMTTQITVASSYDYYVRVVGIALLLFTVCILCQLAYMKRRAHI